MPGRFPTLEDVALPNVGGARPVATIDPSGWGRGAEALARAGQKLGGDIQQSAADIVQGNIDLQKKQVENGLMDLSTSYIANRNQYSLSNDPAHLDNWRKANADAEQRFNAAIPGPDTYLGQHARGRAGLMAGEENYRITERGHALAMSQAEADTLQDIANLRNTTTPASLDASGRPDVTREAQLAGVHGRIDQRVANGTLTPEKAQVYKQQAASTYAESEIRAVIAAANAEQDPDKAQQYFKLAAHMMGRWVRGGGQPIVADNAAALVSQGETGDKSIGVKAIGNISPDSRGSRSYGFMGLNSASGSAAAFVRDYGAGFGLTAAPGTPQFDAQWKAAATSQTDAFRNAQLRYFNERIVPSISADLQKYGVPADIASDPRVATYFADRKVQMGDVAMSNIEPAWRGAHGDVPTFLRNMNAIDGAPQQLQRNFQSAIASGVYGPEGHATRLATRLNGALGAGAVAISPAAAPVTAGTQLAQTGAPPIAPEQQQQGPEGQPWPAHPITALVNTALRPEQLDALSRMIEVGRRAKEIDQARATAAAEKAQKDAYQDLEDRVFVTSLFDPTHPPLTPNDVAGLVASGQIHAAQGERLLRLQEWVTREQQVGDDKKYGPGFWDYYKRVHARDDDPQRIADPDEIYRAAGPDNGQLTMAGAKELVSQIKATQKPEDAAENAMRRQFLDWAKHEVSGEHGMLKMKDPKGEEIFTKYLQYFFPAYEKGRKDGKTPGELLDTEKGDLAKTLKGMKRPMSEWLQDVVNDSPDMAVAGGAPAGAGAPAAPAPKFDPAAVKSLADLQAAYRAGQVDRATASAIAIERGWARATAPPPSPAPPPQVPMSQ